MPASTMFEVADRVAGDLPLTAIVDDSTSAPPVRSRRAVRRHRHHWIIPQVMQRDAVAVLRHGEQALEVVRSRW